MTFLSKRAMALDRLGVSKELQTRIESFRIGVITPSQSTNGSRLLAVALGDVLGRFWRSVDASGAGAPELVAAANAAAASGGQAPCASERWSPSYDVTLALGCAAPSGGRVVRVGASGWRVMVGNDAIVDDNANPIGPAIAAAVVAAEVFRIAFEDVLTDRIRFLPAEMVWNAWELGGNGLDVAAQPLALDSVPLFGVGAVGHGLLWALERWPSPVSGELHLVDRDCYDESNAQRYAGMRAEDVGRSKVEQWKARLEQRHPGLKVVAITEPMNGYYEKHRTNTRTPLGIIGVDSKEDRRQFGLKLPRRAVNMWTDGAVLGVGRHGIGDGWPCLLCTYPEDAAAPFDEVGELHRDTGLPPARIRQLLDAGGVLDGTDAAEVIKKVPSLALESIIGKPLRSVRGQLCAVMPMALSDTSTSDVPLPFVSFLCGLMGFVELARELQRTGTPGAWQLNGLKVPGKFNWTEAAPRPGCFLCSDELATAIVRERYRR